MRYTSLSVLIIGLNFSVVNSQTYLDPANFPSYGSPGWCDTAGKIAAYRDIYRGITPYSVGLGRQIPGTGTSSSNPARYYAPVIDGYLEDSIWFYAETLLINSWEVSGYDACCNTAGVPNFYGAKDLHAIWRFFYNQDGLYISCEVHDDVHDVDSLGGWYDQDAIDIGIDPWDWGDFSAGYWANNQYRAYSCCWAQYVLIPCGYECSSYSSFVHIIKRLNEEPYVAGLIHGKQLNNYGRGDEATNYQRGNSDVYGIDFAVTNQGVDDYFRTIHHVEFKFPFHNALWFNLDSRGFFDSSGLPKAGNLFKMAFANNDDDIPGPNGANSTTTWSSSWRTDPFFMEEPSGHDYWADTKYYPAFRYEATTFDGVHVNTGAMEYEDGRVSGLWVDAVTEQTRYAFSSGVVDIGGTKYNFDSTGTGAGISGKLFNQNKDSVGYYYIKWGGTPGFKAFNDTLFLTVGQIQLTLLRFTCYCGAFMYGRWVEVNGKPDTIRESYCDTSYSRYSIKPNALEYRFCPLSRMDTAAAPAFKGCRDSLRVYDYATGDYLYHFAFTDRKVILGRDSIFCSFYITKLIDPANPAAPKHLIVKYVNGDSAIFQEILPYPLMSLGETGNNVNKTITLLAKTPTATDSLLKMYVFDKYTNKVNLYPNPAATSYKYRIMIYPDIVLCTDSSKSFAWSKVFGSAIQLDSFQLLNYDKATKIATGLGTKADTVVWPDSSWILQRTTMVFTSPVSSDTFVFQDTTQVTYTGIFNVIDTNRCINGIQENADLEVKTVEVTQYPNPFNPATTIRFVIPGSRFDQHFSLNVYNVRGQLVRTLAKGVVDRFGVKRRIVWNGMDNYGKTVGSGIYYYQLGCGKLVRKGTMVMVR